MISPNHLAKLNKRLLWSKKFFNESYGKLSAEKIINAKEGKFAFVFDICCVYRKAYYDLSKKTRLLPDKNKNVKTLINQNKEN